MPYRARGRIPATVRGKAISITVDNRAFLNSLDALIRKLHLNAYEAVSKAALDIIRDVALETPVDTGRCRAAWTVFLEAFGTSVPITGPNVDQAAIEQGRQEGRWVANEHGLKPAVVVVNQVPYAVYLEYGWSDQSPNGMVRVTLKRHTREFKRMLRWVATHGSLYGY